MDKIKVIKFGGTSLKTSEDRLKVINIIKEESKKKSLVVVVSAMGRYPDPYATDTLLKKAECLNEKNKDEIMSCGEIISSHYLCNECIKEGLDCGCINILENGIKTNENYGNGNILFVDSNKIYNELKKHRIIIVPGFFGTNKLHYVTALGRGGSDLSAVLIAHALGNTEVTIYSDVEGIYSADPKKIRDAILFKHVNITQALLLSGLNVAVIQYKACEFSKKHNIKMILKSTFRLDGLTIVDHKGEMHDFLIVDDDGYFILTKNNLVIRFSKKISPSDAHALFIE